MPKTKGGRLYGKLPLAVGIFEYQVVMIMKEVAEDFFKYEDDGFAETFLKGKTKQMPTIPVNIDIKPNFLVGSYDNARILETAIGIKKTGAWVKFFNHGGVHNHMLATAGIEAQDLLR